MAFAIETLFDTCSAKDAYIDQKEVAAIPQPEVTAGRLGMAGDDRGYGFERGLHNCVQRVYRTRVIQQEVQVNVGVLILKLECDAPALPSGEHMSQWLQRVAHGLRDSSAEGTITYSHDRPLARLADRALSYEPQRLRGSAAAPKLQWESLPEAGSSAL